MKNGCKETSKPKSAQFQLSFLLILSLVLTAFVIYTFSVASPYKWIAALPWLIFQFRVAFGLSSILKELNLLHQQLKEVSSGISTDQILPKSELLEPLFRLINQYKDQHTEIVTKVAVLGKSEVLNFQNIPQDSTIGAALIKTNEDFYAFKKLEKQRLWKNTEVTEFATFIRESDKELLDEFSNAIISRLARGIKANQGALYLAGTSSDGSIYLESQATYAWGKRKHLDKIQISDGLLGQVVYSKDTIYVTDVPSDYITITSGLGEATPTALLIVPLMVNDQFVGAIELAAFNSFSKDEIEFVTEIAGHIAHIFLELRSSSETKKLLEESQSMASELKEQEEEMRQNLEELEATQEEMKRNKLAMDNMFSALDSTLSMAQIDLEGQLISANRNLLEIYNCSLEQLQQEGITNIFGDEQQFEKIRSTIQSGEIQHLETKIVRDSKVLWLYSTFSPETNADGTVRQMLMLSKDITVEKELEEINESKQKELASYHEAIDSTIASCQFNLDGNLIEANNIFIGVSAYSREELLSMKFLDLIPPVDRDKPQTKLMWDSAIENQLFSGEFKIMDREGKELFLSGTLTRIKSGGKDKILMLAHFITEEKEKKNILDGFANSLKNTTPIIELKPDGTIKNCSPLFYKIFGYKRMEINKKNIYEIVKESYTTDLITDINFLESGRYQDHALDIIDKEGDVHFCRVTLNPVYDLKDELERIILVLIDMSPLDDLVGKQMQEHEN